MDTPSLHSSSYVQCAIYFWNKNFFTSRISTYSTNKPAHLAVAALHYKYTVRTYVLYRLLCATCRYNALLFYLDKQTKCTTHTSHQPAVCSVCIFSTSKYYIFDSTVLVFHTSVCCLKVQSASTVNKARMNKKQERSRRLYL